MAAGKPNAWATTARALWTMGAAVFAVLWIKTGVKSLPWVFGMAVLLLLLAIGAQLFAMEDRNR